MDHLFLENPGGTVCLFAMLTPHEREQLVRNCIAHRSVKVLSRIYVNHVDNH